MPSSPTGAARAASGSPPDRPLPLLWRIRDKATFEALARAAAHGGGRARSGPVSVSWLPAAGAPSDPPRVAFAVGRRVGGAVVRNRLRRRCRGLLVEEVRAGRLRPGAYLVSLAPEATHLDGADLRRHVRRALERVAR